MNIYSITLQLIPFPKLNTLVSNKQNISRTPETSWFSSYLPLPPLRATHILTFSRIEAFYLFFYFISGIPLYCLSYVYQGIVIKPTSSQHIYLPGNSVIQCGLDQGAFD